MHLPKVGNRIAHPLFAKEKGKRRGTQRTAKSVEKPAGTTYRYATTPAAIAAALATSRLGGVAGANVGFVDAHSVHRAVEPSEIEIGLGTHLDDAIFAIASKANVEQRPFTCLFSGVRLVAHPGDDAGPIRAQWDRAMEEAHAAYNSPEAKAEREAEREARLADEAAAIVRVAALEGTPGREPKRLLDDLRVEAERAGWGFDLYALAHLEHPAEIEAFAEHYGRTNPYAEENIEHALQRGDWVATGTHRSWVRAKAVARRATAEAQPQEGPRSIERLIEDLGPIARAQGRPVEALGLEKLADPDEIEAMARHMAVEHSTATALSLIDRAITTGLVAPSHVSSWKAAAARLRVEAKKVEALSSNLETDLAKRVSSLLTAKIDRRVAIADIASTALAFVERCCETTPAMHGWAAVAAFAELSGLHQPFTVATSRDRPEEIRRRATGLGSPSAPAQQPGRSEPVVSSVAELVKRLRALGASATTPEAKLDAAKEAAVIAFEMAAAKLGAEPVELWQAAKAFFRTERGAGSAIHVIRNAADADAALADLRWTEALIGEREARS